MYYPTCKYHKNGSDRTFANEDELRAAIKAEPGCWYDTPADFGDETKVLTFADLKEVIEEDVPLMPLYKRGNLMKLNKAALVDILNNDFGVKLDDMATRDDHADAILAEQKKRG